MSHPNPFVAAMADDQFSQAGRRTSYNVTDQHRRKWLISVEMTRRGPSPVGVIIPCFDDPLRTPQQYLVYAPPYGLHIDYPRWISDTEGAVREWTERRDDMGREIYDDRYDPDTPIEQLPGRGKELLRLIGKPPIDPAILRRAAAGDKAVLKGIQPVRKRKPGRPAKRVVLPEEPDKGEAELHPED